MELISQDSPTNKKELSLQKAGLTTDKLMSSLATHLTAVETKVGYDETGRPVETEVPLWAVQEKAQEKLIRIKELVKPDVGPVSVQVNIGVNAIELRELLGFLADVKMQLASLRGSGRQTGEVIDV